MSGYTHLAASAIRAALWGALVVSVAGYSSFLVLEPWGLEAIAQSDVEEFLVTQSITAEVAFAATVADVTMSPSIPGLTGGTANGQTNVAVITNDPAGFTMTIEAEDSAAMQGNTQGGEISDYVVNTTWVPDYAFDTTTTPGIFGYTVSASTTADLAQKFKDDGASACGTGSADTNGSATCWYGLSTVATSTIVRTTETDASGEEATIYFRVYVPMNPNPLLPEDTYTATTTLTATVN